ncbi:ferrous iron transport protein B [Desulfofundulus sp.]|uniref:ferrous iron transport protein B n=1 Tax=Desulfofundulus sp. TaxID=2282750 RepID=UPI003C707F15
MEVAPELKPAGIVIALAGNPNSGKTSIFNNLTGARQHVGNWPGVTVEKKEGRLIYEGVSHRVVDLPGIYSVGAVSEDEIIARNYILKEKPDVIINVIDASNIERNLYLTIQLLEMGANVVLALNMMDEAESRHISIDVARLSEILGISIVPTVATKKQGMKELLTCAFNAARNPKQQPLKITYQREVEEELASLETIIASHAGLMRDYPLRWLAIKLLEEDDRFVEEIRKYPGSTDLLARREKSVRRLRELTGEEPEILLADQRYGFIGGLVRETVKRHTRVEQRLSLSDKIDRIVTNRYLGLPIFLFSMWAVFQFTFKLGNPMVDWIETFFQWLGEVVGKGLSAVGAPQIVNSLVVDGIIGGVGAVLVFVPLIFLLFLAISFLEDSGYMARAAYIMDRFMHALGLHGKSFMPMLIGFGCNVPAILATRTLENKRDRLITILINPLMSCTARLPIYVLFAGAFFGARQGLVVFSIYLLGILLAIIMGKVFQTFLFKGEAAPFVMELPPYRMPTLRGTLIHMWDRGSAFLRKAGTIIFGVVVLIWLLSVLPWGVEPASRESLIGRLGAIFAPVLAPAGFGTWEAASALLFGLLAKEVVVSTLGVIYGVGEEAKSLIPIIQQHWTPLSAYAFMAMCLIYIPCAATIGAIKRETNSWKWTAFAIGYSLVLGWLVAVIIYQVGHLLGLS